MMKKSIFTLLILVVSSLLPWQVLADVDTLGLMTQHSFSSAFSIDETDSSVRVILPNKKTNTFVLGRDFTYIPKNNNGLSLEVSGDEYRIFDSEDKTKYTFSLTKNRLETILSGSGKLLSLNYDKNERLFYVTDNQNNTLYFSYDEASGLVSKIEDIFNNSLQFTYDKIPDGTFILSQLLSNGKEVPLKYDESGVLGQVPQIALSFSPNFRKKITYSTSSGETIFDPIDATIHYKKQGNMLYSFYDGNIFSIDAQGKRKAIVGFKGAKIDDLYVTPKGVVYYQVGDSIKKYLTNESRSTELYKAKNIAQFLISNDEGSIYTLDTFTPGYKVYSLKNKQEIELQTSERFDSFESTGSGVLAIPHSDFYTWQENPEFSARYEKFLKNLEAKLTKLTAKQKARLTQDIQKYKEKLTKGKYEIYQREKILYLLEQIEKQVNY